MDVPVSTMITKRTNKLVVFYFDLENIPSIRPLHSDTFEFFDRKRYVGIVSSKSETACKNIVNAARRKLLNFDLEYASFSHFGFKLEIYILTSSLLSVGDFFQNSISL